MNCTRCTEPAFLRAGHHPRSLPGGTNLRREPQNRKKATGQFVPSPRRQDELSQPAPTRTTNRQSCQPLTASALWTFSCITRSAVDSAGGFSVKRFLFGLALIAVATSGFAQTSKIAAP